MDDTTREERLLHLFDRIDALLDQADELDAEADEDTLVTRSPVPADNTTRYAYPRLVGELLQGDPRLN